MCNLNKVIYKLITFLVLGALFDLIHSSNFCPEPLSAQKPAACTGPAELERAIASQPSASAYNALGAYFAQRNQFSCASSAFEKALRLDPKYWETRGPRPSLN